MFGLFKNKDKEKDSIKVPSIMGLRMGCSFEVDPLLLKLINNQVVADGIAPTQIIEAVGLVELQGTYIFRFYTDDEGFLQVIADGGKEEQHVVDVKLFHFYNTASISSQSSWDDLLKKQIGNPTYNLEGNTYHRVWESVDDYHAPVHMEETTYSDEGKTISKTDQFTMLYEREISNDLTESLFLSAEETEAGFASLDRCLVSSTGITLSPAQITIHG